MRLPTRVFGAPLHPILVHLPVGFLLTVPLFDLAALYVAREPWWTLSLYATAAGLAVGFVVIVTGIFEYFQPSVAGLDFKRALWHGVLTTTASCAFAAKMLLVFTTPPAEKWLLAACLALDVVGWALLLQGVYIGTRQIFDQLETRL